MAISTLLVQADLNVNTGMLALTDLIADDYNIVHGYTLTDVKGIFKITGPLGVIYQNTGWDTDDYSLPDIEGTTPDWDKGSIALPLDSGGKTLLGVYKVEYKVTLDGTGTTTFGFDKNYTNLYVAPVPILLAVSDIPTSLMNVTDDTDYVILVGGVYYNPDAPKLPRDMTIRWPISSGVADTSTELLTIQLGPNLWTGNYDITTTVPVTYTLPAETNLTVKVTDVVEGLKDDVNIRDDDFTVTVERCLEKLTSEYEQAKQLNLPEAQSIKKNLDDMMLYYEMYKMALATGQDIFYAYSRLNTLIVQNGCPSSQYNISHSMEIIPVTSEVSKYEEIVTDVAGKDTFDLPFTLTTNSLALVDGQALLNVQITGFGTNEIVINQILFPGQVLIVIEKVF